MCGTSFKPQIGIPSTANIADTDTTNQDGMSNTSHGGTSGTNSTCQINTSDTSQKGVSDIGDYNKVGMARLVSFSDMANTSEDATLGTDGNSDDNMPSPHSGGRQNNSSGSSCSSSGGSEMILGFSDVSINHGSADSESRLLATPSEGSTATGSPSGDSELLNSEETEDSSLSDDTYVRVEAPRVACFKEPEGRATDAVIHVDVKL